MLLPVALLLSFWVACIRRACLSLCCATLCAVLRCRDLGMEDLQYFRHVYDAASFFAAPLVVSRSALGALCLASAQSNAFTG